MADDKQLNRQASEAQQQEQSAQIKGTEALCKHCGTALEADQLFCSECGEKIGGEELECQFCKTKTSMDFCPHCGRRVIPLNCFKCNVQTIYDACENCGTILNPVLAQSFNQEAYTEPAVMSSEEAAKIDAEFKTMEQESESAEFKAFQKKLIERQILLEERDYFNKREKRIIKAFGSQPFSLELPDPEEEAFRMKAFAALEKTIIEREEKMIEDTLAKMFPAPVVVVDTDTSAEDERLAEIEQNREKMERQFNEMLASVNNEVDEFKKEEERKRVEAERRRIEEERRRIEEERRRLEEERKRKEAEAKRQREIEIERQRQIEIERQRLEQERRRKRFDGSYYHSSHNGMLSASLMINGSRAVCQYRCTVCGGATINYSTSIDGNNIQLISGSKYGDHCTWREYKLVENYLGTTNDSGTVLNGQWHKYGESVPITFYKR
jgi:hypothetical protein